MIFTLNIKGFRFLLQIRFIRYCFCISRYGSYDRVNVKVNWLLAEWLSAGRE